MPVFVVTIGDIVVGVIFGIFLVTFIFLAIKQGIKEVLCKHDGGVSETRACEAICHKCGKNLGFIGSYKERYGVK
jgi:MFS superfamily sulfate permease-like transporter